MLGVALTRATLAAFGLVMAVAVPADASWTSPFEIAPGVSNARAPRVGFVLPSTVGAGFANSEPSGGAPSLRTRPPGGTFASLPAPAPGAEDLALAPASGSGALLATTQLDQATGATRVLVQELDAAGAVRAAITIPNTTGLDDGDPAIAALPGGGAAVSFKRGSDQASEVRLVVGANVAALDAGIVVSGGDSRAGDPAVAAAGDGTVHVAWSRLDQAGASRVKRRSLARGVLGTTANVSPEGVSGGSVDLATNAAALATAWVETAVDDGAAPDADAPGSLHFQIDGHAVGSVPALDAGSPSLAARPALGAFGLAFADDLPTPRVQVVEAAGSAASSPIVLSGADRASAPDLAYDGRGDGVVTWRAVPDADTPEVGRARGAGFDGAAPEILSADIGPSAVAGTPVTAQALTRDTWSAVRVRWDFGDGETADGAQVSHVFATAGARDVTVTADDGDGHVATITRRVEVSPTDSGEAPAPPLALAYRRAGGRGDRSASVYAQGQFELCITKLGCIQQKQPWLRVVLNGDGTYSYRSGGT